MDPGYVFKGILRWLSTWRDKSESPDRRIEFMDIGLVEMKADNKKVLAINNTVQPNSAWAHVEEDDKQCLVLKLNTSDKSDNFRYYGFDWRVMTVDGKSSYLCQHSTKAKDNPEHTIGSYMEMFAAKKYKEEQVYHISLTRTESSILVA